MGLIFIRRTFITWETWKKRKIRSETHYDFGTHLYIDSTPWYNATPLYVPIIHNELGVFNYTIIYTTITGETGSDSVIIRIVEKQSDNSSGPSTNSLLNQLDPYATEIALLGLVLGIIAILLALRKPKIKPNSKEEQNSSKTHQTRQDFKNQNQAISTNTINKTPEKNAESTPNKDKKTK